MDARLGRHQADRVGRDVRCVRDDDVDAAPQRVGQRVEEVTLEDLTPGPEVRPGAANGCRLDVGREHFEPGLAREQGCGHRARPAAHVDDHHAGRCERVGLLHEQFGAPARDEDSGLDDDAQTAERGPADDDLEGFARDPPLDQGFELVRGRGGVNEHPRLVFSEDGARRAQPIDDG